LFGRRRVRPRPNSLAAPKGARNAGPRVALAPPDPRTPPPRGDEASRSQNRKSAEAWRPARGVYRLAPRPPRWADNFLPTANNGSETRDRRTSPRRTPGMVTGMPFDLSVRLWRPAGPPGKPRLGPPRSGVAYLHPGAATALTGGLPRRPRQQDAVVGALPSGRSRLMTPHEAPSDGPSKPTIIL
jgi:hypothetical protein